MRTWICWYLQDKVTVRAPDKGTAQQRACSALNVSPTKAMYIVAHTEKYNFSGDRHTRCYGQVTA